MAAPLCLGQLGEDWSKPEASCGSGCRDPSCSGWGCAGRDLGAFIPRIVTSDNFLVEALHIFGFEGRLQRGHLVDHAPEGPNVAFAVVGLVLPDFGTGVVGGSRLRVEQPLLGHLGNVHVAEFDVPVGLEEDIGAFEVPMQDSKLVEGSQRARHLVSHAQDFGFLHVGVGFDALLDFLVQVSVVSKFHNHAST